MCSVDNVPIAGRPDELEEAGAVAEPTNAGDPVVDTTNTGSPTAFLREHLTTPVPRRYPRPEIRLTQKEYALLKDKVDLFETESERILAGARPAGSDGVVLTGRLDDVEFLVGEVAFNANHCETASLERRLDQLFARLDAAIP